MGIHTCHNPAHVFDNNRVLEAYKIKRDNGEEDVIYQGFCPICNTYRVVYESQLKDEKIIEMKMRSNYRKMLEEYFYSNKNIDRNNVVV